MKHKVMNTELAILHWNDVSGVITMFDTKNLKVIKRKVRYVGKPLVAAVLYQYAYHFTCNMGSIKHGEIRY